MPSVYAAIVIIFGSYFCCKNISEARSQDQESDTGNYLFYPKANIQGDGLFFQEGYFNLKVKPFWKSTGLCPPDPHDESEKFLLSPDMEQNIFHIGSLPFKGIRQVRIHWMLDLVKFRIFSKVNVSYDFSNLDELVFMLWKNGLRPGFELMGNPSNYFTDFENATQVYLWRNLVRDLALHYIGKYGVEYVAKWNFETWNEPDHHDFDNLNFTIKGFLNYYDACSDGLKQADVHLRFGGPGGSCHVPSTGNSPICWALLDHCIRGKNFFTKETGVRIDFISFHKKGNASTSLIIVEELETIHYIQTQFPALHSPFYNDEADPIKNWARPLSWRADATYAAMVVKIVLSHIFLYSTQKIRFPDRTINFELLSSDNAFLSYFPFQFTERTLLARFQVNNTYPKYVEFVKKPVYAAIGLLGLLCPYILPLKIKSNNLNNIGILATQCKYSREIVIVLHSNENMNVSTLVKVVLNISKPFDDARWAVFEVNNYVSNPYKVWEDIGKPSFPSTDQFSLMKTQEDPKFSGPWKLSSSHLFKFNLQVTNPSVILLNICEKQYKLQKINNIRIIKTWNYTLQISWDNYNRCISTYNIMHSVHKNGPYVKLNNREVIFPTYWHACMKKDCKWKGFYRVKAIDYWGRNTAPSKPLYFPG